MDDAVLELKRVSPRLDATNCKHRSFSHRLGRVALARGWQAWVDCHLETLDRRLAALDAHIDAAAIAAEEDAWARAEFGLDA